MNEYLSRLGVPPEIQAFFKITADLSFDFGDSCEVFGDNFHRVPTTTNLWVAGNESALEVVVTYSALEAIAFLTVNRVRYPKFHQLAFVAIGNRLHPEQTDWIRQHFPKRKFTLVFGNGLLGHITDIKLTAALKNLSFRIFHANHKVMAYRIDELKIFEDEQLSLHAFKIAFGIRGKIRTRKPTQSLTFLDQLKHDADR
jgi:hypothetical protein